MKLENLTNLSVQSNISLYSCLTAGKKKKNPEQKNSTVSKCNINSEICFDEKNVKILCNQAKFIGNKQPSL